MLGVGDKFVIRGGRQKERGKEGQRETERYLIAVIGDISFLTRYDH